MQIIKIKISTLSINSGQIEGIPANPRLIRDANYRRLLKSITEDPGFMDAKPVHVFRNVVMLGNMRFRACQELGWKEIPAIRYPDDLDTLTLKSRIVKDNSHYGENDWEAFANEWSDCPLNDWGAMKQNYDFTPNLEPETSGSQVTQSDINKAKEKLDGAYSGGHTDMFEVCCPKCAHVFDIKKS